MDEEHGEGATEGSVPPWHRRIAQAFRIRYASYGEHGLAWRVLTPVVFVVAGTLFVTSAVNSRGTDLRPGRYDDLADLAADRSDRIAELEQRSARLQAQIDRLTEDLDSSALDEVQAELDKLKGPGGLEAVEGPGLTITLDDAPRQVLDDGTGDISVKIVHQQDIQAVANALWAGGAEAITVQGKRITSTTGIKCIGSSVLLQGVQYPPPYVIAAIGSTTRLLNAVDEDPAILRYLRDAEIYDLGWDVELSDKLTFPRYEGPIETSYAEAVAPDDGT